MRRSLACQEVTILLGTPYSTGAHPALTEMLLRCDWCERPASSRATPYS